MSTIEVYRGGVTPERMFQRQEQKAHVLTELVDRLGLAAGDRVLEIGSGPGFVSLLAAERVGPTGRVWALDVSDEALGYLADRCAERGFGWLSPIVGDAAAFAAPAADVSRFLVIDMLHHTEDPEAIVRHLSEILPAGARGVVSEYLPVTEKRFGPDPAMRIPEERARGWFAAARFSIVSTWYPPDEHYAFLVEKG